MRKKQFINKYFGVFILFFLTALTGLSQSLTREIIYTKNDSVYKFDIKLRKERIRTDDLKWYYWYSDSQINKNMGNYEGFLLHGRYTVFDEDKNLIVKGSFFQGQKDDEWYYWESNGKLILKEKYNKGNLVDKESFMKNENQLSEKQDQKRNFGKIFSFSNKNAKSGLDSTNMKNDSTQ